MSLKLGRRGLWGSRWSLRGREPPNVTNGRSSEIAVRPPLARMNVSIAAAPVRLFPKTCPWTIYTRVGHRQSSESLVVEIGRASCRERAEVPDQEVGVQNYW